VIGQVLLHIPDAMNHPSRDTWMSHLYGELSSRDRAAADAHLAACPTCQASLRRWRETMARLDQDQATLATGRRARSSRWKHAVFPMAAAAALLATGFWAGRASSPSRADVQREVAATALQIRSDLGERLDEDLRRIAVEIRRADNEARLQWTATLLQSLQAARTDDRRWLLQALESVEARQVLDAEMLRQGLVRLAENTGSGFRQAESQVARLASYLPASAAVPDTFTPPNP